MARIIAAIIGILCLAWLLMAGQLIAPSSANGALICPNDCVTEFAQGCYTGNGGTQTISLAPATFQPALVLTYNVSPGTDTPLGTYRSAEHGAAGVDVSARLIDATLRTNHITAWAAGSFDVGSDPEVNRNGDPYCYFAWGANRLMGTFTYIGDTGIATPRTIAIVGTPTFAAIQYPDDAVSFRRGKFYMRTNAMPASTSYGWHNVAETPPTQSVRNLAANAIIVGSDMNEDGKVYRGFWFGDDPTFGLATTWTGNGDGGDACADASDQQAIGPGCTPAMVMTVGCGGSALICEHDCVAAGHGGVVPIIRGTNMGTAVVGPGHLTDDFTTIYSTGRLNACLGNFTAGTFTVTGAGSFAANLNDVGLTPYAWTVCAPGCVYNP